MVPVGRSSGHCLVGASLCRPGCVRRTPSACTTVRKMNTSAWWRAAREPSVMRVGRFLRARRTRNPALAESGDRSAKGWTGSLAYPTLPCPSARHPRLEPSYELHGANHCGQSHNRHFRPLPVTEGTRPVRSSAVPHSQVPAKGWASPHIPFPGGWVFAGPGFRPAGRGAFQVIWSWRRRGRAA